MSRGFLPAGVILTGYHALPPTETATDTALHHGAGYGAGTGAAGKGAITPDRPT